VPNNHVMQLLLGRSSFLLLSFVLFNYLITSFVYCCLDDEIKMCVTGTVMITSHCGYSP